MAEGRDRHDWRHTAEILAMLLNVNRGSKSAKVWRASDIDPYAGRDGRRTSGGTPLNRDTLGGVMAMFGRKKGKRL